MPQERGDGVKACHGEDRVRAWHWGDGVRVWHRGNGARVWVGEIGEDLALRR